MNSPISIVFYSLCLEILKGAVIALDDDSPSDYHHLPGKIILSNIIRQQNRPLYLKNFQAREKMLASLEGNILTQFLNRFQPAMDRETKKLVDKPVQVGNADTAQDTQNKPGGFESQSLWRDVREDNPLKLGERKLTQCTRVPGRVLCKFGPYTYVINTRNRDIDNEELEKIIGLMHQRIQDGDKNFDLSIISPKEKTSGALDSAAPEPLLVPEEGSGAAYDSPPIIVECTPVDKPSSLSGRDNVEELVYSCKWHSLKLKRGIKVSEGKADDKLVVATPVAKTCSTPISVRKFTDVCTTTPAWCPETTVTPCSTTQLPYCMPWCNPFLKDSNNPKQKLNKN